VQTIVQFYRHDVNSTRPNPTTKLSMKTFFRYLRTARAA
jgi:hypothetical protein